MTVEFWELADFVVEAMQDLGGRAWEEDGVGDHTCDSGAVNSAWSPVLRSSTYLAVWKPRPRSKACSSVGQ